MTSILMILRMQIGRHFNRLGYISLSISQPISHRRYLIGIGGFYFSGGQNGVYLYIMPEEY